MAKFTEILWLAVFFYDFKEAGRGVEAMFKSCRGVFAETSNQNAHPVVLEDCSMVMDENLEEGNHGKWWHDKLGDAIAVFAKRGGREDMEDRYNIRVQGNYIAFGIFDGHGRVDMAEHAANNLLPFVIGALQGEQLESNFQQKILDSIVQFNNDGIHVIRKIREKYAGSTAVIGVVHGDKVYFANVGDSRAVVIHSNGRAEAITTDHNADCLQERQRIVKDLDGDVQKVDGVWRVGGKCAPSRALGDYQLRRFGMTAEADTFTIDLNDPTKEYVVLATDGVWDVIDNEGAAKTVRKHVKGHLFGAEQLVQKAIDEGSNDNVTVMVVKLATIRAWLRQVANRAAGSV